MSAIKFSSKMESKTWSALQRLSKERHCSVSGLLTEATEDYLKRHTLRDEVLRHLDASMDANEELGRLLAK